MTLQVGDNVHVANDSDGRIIGFYVGGETRLIVVVLPSGEQLIAPESAVSLI